MRGSSITGSIIVQRLAIMYSENTCSSEILWWLEWDSVGQTVADVSLIIGPASTQKWDQKDVELLSFVFLLD